MIVVVDKWLHPLTRSQIPIISWSSKNPLYRHITTFIIKTTFCALKKGMNFENSWLDDFEDGFN